MIDPGEFKNLVAGASGSAVAAILSVTVNVTWLSLLAFVLPWRVRNSDWLYCYEWCWYVQTGQMPIERVTPEDLAIEALRQKP